MSDALRLRVLDQGPWKGLQIELSPGGSYTIGSGEECALVLSGAPGVEAVHCVIRPLRGGGFGVKDLGGPQGTRLNGTPIQVARLEPGDRLTLGGVELECARAGAPEPEPQRLARGTPPRPRDLERVGTTIKGYRLIEYLGRGSMGTVYRAEQQSLQRQVALKLLRRELTRDPEFVERFVSEARAAGRFNHPNVVHVYDVGQEGETYYYSMELMDQGSLEEEIAGQGPLALETALKVVRDAARGLRYAEEVGVVHRDIKPDNLMRNAQGVTKIVDLGLASTADEAPAENGTRRRIFGTPHFIAPEQARGGAVDARSDLYSLGCTFYRLVTGRTPFGGSTVKEILRAQLTEEPEPPHKVVPSIPESVSRVIGRLMAKDPAERFQSAEDLLAELDRLEGKGRALRRLVPLAVGALLAGLVVYFAFRPSGSENGIGPGPDPGIQEQLEEAQRARRESDARAEFLKVLALPDQPDKVTALERVAAEYQGTAAAADAQQQVAALTQLLERRAAEAKALAQRLAELREALGQARKEATTHRDGILLLEALDALPHRAELGQDPSLAQTLQEARGHAEELIRARLAGLLETIDKTLEARELATAKESLALLEAGLSEETLSAEFRAELSDRFRPEVERTTRTLEQLRLEATLAESGKDHALFLQSFFRGKESVVAALQALDPSRALAAANALVEGMQTPDFQELLAAKTTLLERADRAWRGFQEKAARSNVLSFHLAGTNWKVTQSAEATQLTLVDHDDGERRRQVRLDAALLAREPALLAALLGATIAKDASGEVFADMAILTALIGPLPLVAAARDRMSAIRSKDPGSGLSPTPVVFELPLLDLAEKAAAKAGPALEAAARIQVEREIRAARLLARALGAFAQNRNLEAAECLERIFTEEADSIVYGLLGSGSALLPDQARPAARGER